MGAGGRSGPSWFQRLDRIRTGFYGCGAPFVTDGLTRFAYEPFIIFVLDILDLVIAVVVHVRVVGKVSHTRFRLRCVTAKLVEELLGDIIQLGKWGDTFQYRPCNELEYLQRTNILKHAIETPATIEDIRQRIYKTCLNLGLHDLPPVILEAVTDCLVQILVGNLKVPVGIAQVARLCLRLLKVGVQAGDSLSQLGTSHRALTTEHLLHDLARSLR